METEAGRTQKGKIAQMFHGISGMGGGRVRHCFSGKFSGDREAFGSVRYKKTLVCLRENKLKSFLQALFYSYQFIFLSAQSNFFQAFQLNIGIFPVKLLEEMSLARKLHALRDAHWN